MRGACSVIGLSKLVLPNALMPTGPPVLVSDRSTASWEMSFADTFPSWAGFEPTSPQLLDRGGDPLSEVGFTGFDFLIQRLFALNVKAVRVMRVLANVHPNHHVVTDDHSLPSHTWLARYRHPEVTLRRDRPNHWPCRYQLSTNTTRPGDNTPGSSATREISHAGPDSQEPPIRGLRRK